MINLIRKSVSVLLWISCSTVLAIALHRLLVFIGIVVGQEHATELRYSSLQMTILTDIAKTLIPTVSGAARPLGPTVCWASGFGATPAGRFPTG
jgi:hypothetical protein